MKKQKIKRIHRNPLGNDQLIRQLEAIIDASTLTRTVTALSDIAYLKAVHVEEAWQDVGLARLWTRAGKLLDTASIKVRKLGV